VRLSTNASRTVHLTPAAKDLIEHASPLADPGFTVPGILLTASETEYLVYPEIVHFREVYGNMNTHPDPKVRAKYLATWNMYSLGYPKLMRSLVAHEFSPMGVATLDWSDAERLFKEDRDLRD
jgi:hypothetical protein